MTETELETFLESIRAAGERATARVPRELRRFEAQLERAAQSGRCQLSDLDAERVAALAAAYKLV